MAKVLKYKSGKSSIEIDGLQKELILQTIRQAEPTISKVLEEETAKLAADSEKKWLVRDPKYGQSQGSKYMHRTGIRIQPPFTIQAFVENTAPYAWAIKVGKKSKSTLREGAPLADNVLWRPAKRRAKNIVEQIAVLTVKNLKKVT